MAQDGEFYFRTIVCGNFTIVLVVIEFRTLAINTKVKKFCLKKKIAVNCYCVVSFLTLLLSFL